MPDGTILTRTTNSLLTYDIARRAIADCVRLDDAKDMHDKAAALRHYALQKNDPERADWLGRIACRAVLRIGELSRELDKVETIGGGRVGMPINGKPKVEVLRESGLSTSAAQRFEALSKKPDIEQIISEYFDACQSDGKAPSVGGLLKQGKSKPEDREFHWTIKPTDNWNFSKLLFPRQDGEDGHGYIPGDLYANCLWYWTKPGQIVAAPMAGAGQIALVYERRYEWAIPEPWDLDLRMFDLNPRGPYIDMIKQNDLTKSLPLKHADYVVMDVPYFGMVEGQYSEKAQDLANMEIGEWSEAIASVAVSCRKAQKKDSLCTVICPNFRQIKTGAVILTTVVIREAFAAAGYRLHDIAYASRRVQQDQTPGMGIKNNMAKRNRTMMTDISEIQTFRVAA